MACQGPGLPVVASRCTARTACRSGMQRSRLAARSRGCPGILRRPGITPGGTTPASWSGTATRARPRPPGPPSGRWAGQPPLAPSTATPCLSGTRTCWLLPLPPGRPELANPGFHPGPAAARRPADTVPRRV